jgi:hypothetical protein
MCCVQQVYQVYFLFPCLKSTRNPETRIVKIKGGSLEVLLTVLIGVDSGAPPLYNVTSASKLVFSGPKSFQLVALDANCIFLSQNRDLACFFEHPTF